MTTPTASETQSRDTDRRRALKPLARLAPFIAAHRNDAILAGMFLIVSASATMGLPFAVPHMADKGLASQAAALIDRSFLVLALVAGVLALSTGGRFYFITKLG